MSSSWLGVSFARSVEDRGRRVTRLLGTCTMVFALLAVGLVAAPAGAASTSWGGAQEVPGSATLNVAGDAQVNSVSCTAAGSVGNNCSAGGSYVDGTGSLQAFVVDEVNGTWTGAQVVPGSSSLNAAGNAQVTGVSCTTTGPVGNNCSAGGFYEDATGVQPFVVDEVNGTWGSAQQVPGSGVLNVNGDGQVLTVSCTTAGAVGNNCSAGGFYHDASNDFQAFVVDEVNGTWGSAQQVPGSGSLNVTGYSQVLSISCTTAGTAGNDCGAGGSYLDASGDLQAFVVDEVNGTWSSAQEVPGSAALNVSGASRVLTISCSTTGASGNNCSAGGYFDDSTGDQAFVVDEVNGTWASAHAVPGSVALNVNGDAQVNSISCTSPGSSGNNCSAGGTYADVSGGQALVVDEVNGTWSSAQEVPDSASLNADAIGDAAVVAISCSTKGSSGNNCSAGGYYRDAAGLTQAFVVDEENGTWSGAQEVPGGATLNATGDAQVSSVSCATPGGAGNSCSAGGFYKDGSGSFQAFVADESSAPATGGSGGGGGGSAPSSGVTLVITATSESVDFGGAVTSTSSIASGLLAGDSASVTAASYTYLGIGSTTYGPSAATPTAVGTYSVTPSNATVTVTPPSDQANYSTDSTYVAGQLTIVADGVTKVALRAVRVIGIPRAGRTVSVRIVGSGFYAKPRITSSTGRATSARVTRDTGTELTVRVRVHAGTRRGVHTFTIKVASGTTCRVTYHQL